MSRGATQKPPIAENARAGTKPTSGMITPTLEAPGHVGGHQLITMNRPCKLMVSQSSRAFARRECGRSSASHYIIDFLLSFFLFGQPQLESSKTIVDNSEASNKSSLSVT